MKYLLVQIILFVAIVALWLVQGWLFFVAPCETVKEYYSITHTPARCL